MASLSTKEVALYGGNTHACVGYSPSNAACGQILPPNYEALSVLENGGRLMGCVRTTQLRVQCGYVQKLYTPNFFVDNWVWFVIIALAAYFIYRYRVTEPERRVAEAERLADEAKQAVERMNTYEALCKSSWLIGFLYKVGLYNTKYSKRRNIIILSVAGVITLAWSTLVIVSIVANNT